ncbi:MAG TPA: hypothetical protein PLO32_09470, partial [Chitinophagales bacterium]|nr:hypothetical protein [Chitinophagales bacterium]
MLNTKKYSDLQHPNSFLFFINNLLQIRNDKIDFFIKQKEKLGDIYKLEIPNRKVVVVTQPEWIKYI